MEERIKKNSRQETLRVGGTVTVGACLLSHILADFTSRMPEVQTFTCVANTRTMEEKLLQSELDIAIVEGTIHSPDLVSIPSIRDSLMLGCSISHPLASKEEIHISELNHQRFVMREQGSGTRALFDQFLSRHHLKIEIAWEAGCPDAIRNAILHNNCLAAISVRLMEQDIREGRIRIYSTPTNEFQRSFSLVYHKDKLQTPAMAALRHIIDQYQEPDWMEQVPVGRLVE